MITQNCGKKMATQWLDTGGVGLDISMRSFQVLIVEETWP